MDGDPYNRQICKVRRDRMHSRHFHPGFDVLWRGFLWWAEHLDRFWYPLPFHHKPNTNSIPNRNLPALTPDTHTTIPDHKTILNLRPFPRHFRLLQSLNLLAKKIPEMVQNLHFRRVAIHPVILPATVLCRLYNTYNRSKGTHCSLLKISDHDQHCAILDHWHFDTNLLFHLEHIHRESNLRHPIPLLHRAWLQIRARVKGPDEL